MGAAYGKFHCMASLHGIPPRTVIPDLVFCNLLRDFNCIANRFVLNSAEKIRLLGGRFGGEVIMIEIKNVSLTLQKNEILKSAAAHFERGKSTVLLAETAVERQC